MFSVDFKVRDYECDIQGIVNNATYQNYLEHTRHEFLQSKGIDFAEYHEKGVDLVLIKAEIEYKKSLKPGDRFSVTLRLEKVGRLKFIFHQELYKEGEDTPVLTAQMTATSLVNGRPRPHTELLELLFAE
ncbi:MAG: acyl-CoA thioesterase [Fibrobacterales bacterium]